MIRLFGVVHGGHVANFFEGIDREIDLKPTSELKEKLIQLPRDTKVGIEWLAEDDWKQVIVNFRNLCLENCLTGGYSVGDSYWEQIIKICK